MAADIRKLRKPEPYKGKGIRYAGERVDPQGRQGGQVAMATAAAAQADAAHPAPRPGPQARGRHHEPAPAGRVPFGTPHLGPGHRRHRRAARWPRRARWRRRCAAPPAATWPPPTAVGKLVADRAKSAGVTQVVFDRGGFRYHGRVAALADAAREGGLEF